MAASKKRVLRPNLGGSLRPYAEAPRRRFLYTDVTKAEHGKIQQHCQEKQISISQFLADLMLQDALRPTPKHRRKVHIQVEFDLTPDELDKLQLLTRLHQKQSISDFVREILQPYFEIQRLHAPLETTALRYYLSKEEHEKVTKHVARKGISARNHAAMLALKALQTSLK
jgi:hypothetical protein